MNTDITTTFKNYVDNGGVLHYRATLVLDDTNKTTLELNDDDFLQDTWEFQYDSCEGDFDIGGAIPSQFKCTLNNLTDKFTKYVSYLDGATITVYLQSVKETETYNEKTCLVTKTFTKDEEFCWGTFVVNVDFQHYETINLQCYDRLYLLKQQNILEYVNSLPASKKFTYRATNATNILSVLKKWLADFGITSITSKIDVSKLVGNFILPIEFYDSTTNIPTYYAKKLYTVDSTYTTSEYDSRWVADSDLWEKKSLLDFVKYFAQIFGEFAYLKTDGCSLVLRPYQKYNTGNAFPIKNIKNITYAANESYDSFSCAKITTTNANIPTSIIGKYLFLGSTSNFDTHKYSWELWNDYILPAETGGYEIVGSTYNTSYINITDNLLINLPICEVDKIDPSDTYYANIGKIMGINSKVYIIPKYFFYNSPTASNMVDAIQILALLRGDIAGGGGLACLETRTFECSCEPTLGFMAGDFLALYYNQNDTNKYFKSLVAHITFTPNVSMKLSCSFDKSSHAEKTNNAYSYKTYSSRVNLFEQFVKDAFTKHQNCLNSICSNSNPCGYFLEYTGSTKQDGPNQDTIINAYKLIKAYIGDVSGGTGWSYDSGASYTYTSGKQTIQYWYVQVYCRNKSTS